MKSSGLLGTKEVAVRLGVSERTVLKMFAAGKLPAFRIETGDGVEPRLWRTTGEALDAYVERLMSGQRKVA